jgi:hypothetical protein
MFSPQPLDMAERDGAALPDWVGLQEYLNFDFELMFLGNTFHGDSVYTALLTLASCILGTGILYLLTFRLLGSLSTIFPTQAIERQRYITKNLTKSIVLLLMTPHSYYWIILPTIYDEIPYWNPGVRFLGCMYASTDIVALLILRGSLPRNTLIHHMCVTFMAMLNLTVDYSQPTILRGAAMYGAFSAPTYLVNTYLCVRFLWRKYPKPLWTTAVLAFLIYGTSLSINWMYQIKLFRAMWPWALPSYVYLIMALLWLYDDFFLLKHLFYAAQGRLLGPDVRSKEKKEKDE